MKRYDAQNVQKDMDNIKMNSIIDACQCLDSESDLSSMKEMDNAKHPPKTVEKVIGGQGIRQDIPNKDYVSWLEERRDYWITKATEKRIKINSILSELNQIILNQSTVHALCDARYIARCNPQEEQEIGIEQVLDEIRALIEKWS